MASMLNTGLSLGIQQKSACGTFLSPVTASHGHKNSFLSKSEAPSSINQESLLPNQLRFLSKNMGIAAIGSIAGVAGECLLQAFSGGGNGCGGWGDGGFSGGSGGDGGSWHRYLERLIPFANAEAEDRSYDSHGLKVGSSRNITKLNADKRYKISGVELLDKRTGNIVGLDDPFYELITMKPGAILTAAQFQAELENLSSCGMFESVSMDAIPESNGMLRMQIIFAESEWQHSESVRCVNVGLLPQSKPPEVDLMRMTDKERERFMKNQEEEYSLRLQETKPVILPKTVEKELSRWIRGEPRVTARVLQRLRDQIQKWYHDNGFACAQVVNFGNLNTNEIVCEIVEGDITKLMIQFQDKMGLPCEGNTNIKIVDRELPQQLKTGHIFNIEAGKKALRDINSLGLFSNIEVNPRPDEEKEGGIVVEIKLKELDQQTAEVSTEWSISPGGSGWPTLSSIQPGGSVTFEHRNLFGLNRSIFGSVTSNNLLNPQDDLGFKMEYVHPYLDGVDDLRNRTFKASCFNSRKLSPVFTGGPGLDEVPTVWVDRAGLKANITENFTRQSKFTYGLVFEEVTTRDETSAICTNGCRTLPSGAFSMDGPPTTLSDTGMDHVGFFQANVTRDNTCFINGTPVGARWIFQVDQGLGIGSKHPVFNRHQLTATHFLQLKEVQEGGKKAPPPVLVLHGRYGGCVGDLAAYDAFTLGGPYSVRGYNMGELGACRNFLELATELRVPIFGTQTYGFVEYGTDLGSSKDVRGNPTEYFRRAGSGMSYGVGMKLGLIRAEYAQDCNTGSGALFVRFGERF
ncbi:hypothetical protein KP509_11G026700 [Ceratopteris richardii]|uniref:Bacterial surface antigen (D15) domain-containing protein n=2 Tax=Ceratopteris richardii TaxID=49495 RepID=A0A8T2TMX3_CERRI|nr:hypothetical protein KP509_11G026700 [Ceratopteris richardii]